MLRAIEYRLDEKVDQIFDKAKLLLLVEEDRHMEHKHHFQFDQGGQ